MSQTIIDLLPKLRQLFIDDYGKTQFNNEYDITFEIGKKFIRIVMLSGRNRDRSCNGFVCLTDSTTKAGSFKAGDLLKSASWKAPALNFSRGSIFDLEAARLNNHIRWTGIA